MRAAFYDSSEYRRKQSAITARNQERGVYRHLDLKETRICARESCATPFMTRRYEPKKYCSRSCSAAVSNATRVHSDATRRKISASLAGRSLEGKVSPFKGVMKVPRVEVICANPACAKAFFALRTQGRRYCSIACSIQVNFTKPTSPKAARGKSGIRPDISDSVRFYSRWEANFARICNHLGLRWQHTPATFDIGGQNYTPDFYLPDRGVYVEIKNFWNDYSMVRDRKFRKAYPDIPLLVIVKEKYYDLEARHAKGIPGWEYRNSPSPQST